MPVYFHRLENALKRANEFIDVGKKARALEILCDVLRSRKHRQWQKKHEDIMNKYLELCVELRKSYVAKEGIYQYKIICQQTYIKSFEDVVKTYLQMAEAKATSAKEASQASVLDVDDLDNLQTPETILLSAVSSEDTQDRTDRVVLLPWVKFLWESYRQCLDLLKNNARTERLYHDIAHQAFDFCIRYSRKTEFRKLCDNIHAHLDLLKKQQQQLTQTPHQQQNIVNLSNPESQAMHLETRLVQLDCAIQMELWQEAYKATDDIKKFGLMNLSKKPPKPQLMANYYQKLALVFWKANCPLFHASALFKLFNLTKELRKNITTEDLQKLATKVVASTLAVPIPPTRPEIDKLVDTEENVIENHQRNLASLLGLVAVVPTRGSLIKDLKRMGVLQHAYQPLQDLYNWLEVDFHPLKLCSRVQTVIEYIGSCENLPELKQYINALKDVTVIRLLKEISQVYQTIEYDRLLQLCPFVDAIYLENMVVNAARRNDLQVRINHSKRCLFFGTELKMSQGEEIVEGPHLQSMPSEQIRLQLVNVYSVLQKARALIEPVKIKSQRDELKRRIMMSYDRSCHEDHMRILERQNYIERCKEEIEKIGIEREKEEKKMLEEKQQKIRVAEEERMAKEAEERARMRKEKEDQELKMRMAKDQIEKLKQHEMGLRLLDGITEEELSKLRPEEIKSRQWEQLEKERKEQVTKQRKVERKFDHMERAKRIEEIPMLKKAYEEWKVNDEKTWAEMEEFRIKQMIEDREVALQHRQRILRMIGDKEIFSKQLKAQRNEEYQSKFKEWKEIMETEKAKRLAERKEKRKEERRQKYIQRKKEEESERIREAARKRKAEEDAKHQEQQKKQEAREREAMEKQKKREKEREEELMKKEEERQDRLKREEKETVRERKEPDNWRSRDSAEPKPVRDFADDTRNEDKRPWRSNRPRDFGDSNRERMNDRDGHRSFGGFDSGDRNERGPPNRDRFMNRNRLDDRDNRDRDEDRDRENRDSRDFRDRGPRGRGGFRTGDRPPARDRSPRDDHFQKPRNDEGSWRNERNDERSNRPVNRRPDDRNKTRADDMDNWRRGPPQGRMDDRGKSSSLRKG
ncbi:Eukaryotic translation initiation factor 3 subunit A-like protein [Leptotrombidium deliense]|uniref:Eukaryotic translation initiation factor 3 subunit A n=1 Tax=Leptotrombidium deliense TaxID=299467 RepID=A0A443SHP1_9ACAR|nr:Eukaryotic translation initiation factor 3 subunit A-like protein [Leptotrombidium deliense]